MRPWWPMAEPSIFATKLPVPTATEPRIVRGFSVNATHKSADGKPAVWRVEYGPTPAGVVGVTAGWQVTSNRPVPGKREAHYKETWSNNAPNGWSSSALGAYDPVPPDPPTLSVAGGVYTSEEDDEDDVNHISGVGIVHLKIYHHVGLFAGGHAHEVPAFLGGGWPDLRGARLHTRVRSTNWDGKGCRLQSWAQGFHRYWCDTHDDTQNWTLSSRDFTPDIERSKSNAGAWVDIDWEFRNRTDKWTYSGRNDPPGDPWERYYYGELDTLLNYVNLDIFPMMAVGVDAEAPPTGTLDFDDFEMTYRQTNLLAPCNGATLLSYPAGSENPQYLTDGWRNAAAGGPGDWLSADDPVDDQVFVYQLRSPAQILFAQVHNSAAHPSTEFTIEVSNNNIDWVEILAGTLPATSDNGPNYLFKRNGSAPVWGAYGAADNGGSVAAAAVARGSVYSADPPPDPFPNNYPYNRSVWIPIHHASFGGNPIEYVRITVRGPANAPKWGLGEIELFGEGLVQDVEIGDTEVNRDIQVAGGTWYYRVIFDDGINPPVVSDEFSVTVEPAPP